jgi:hypothetical protein
LAVGSNAPTIEPRKLASTLLHVAVFGAGALTRLGLGHPEPHQLIGAGIEMEADLVFNLTVHHSGGPRDAQHSADAGNPDLTHGQTGCESVERRILNTASA